MPDLVFFKSLRPVRVASTSGFIAVITPDEPVGVPVEAYKDAYAAGCVPVEGDFSAAAKQLGAEEREKAVRDTIRAMIAANKQDDFNKDGSPRVHAVRRKSGVDATPDEIRVQFEIISLGGEDDGDS